MSIGFVGLGVMGAPMCRNLAQKSGRAVLGLDADPAAPDRLAAHGVRRAADLAEIAACDDVFLSLPSGREVEAVCAALLPHARPGLLVVDTGTTPVALTRHLASEFARRGAEYADAPIARTREAAEAGTLSVMVGTDSDAVWARLQPLLACVATEVTRCGGVGAGQVVKTMNNMVLFQTVVALSEALAVARDAGVDGEVLFSTLTKGSADSFALRNHGMKAVLPGRFPERAFSADYALKDLSYALDLAREQGRDLPGARLAEALLRRAIAAGHGAEYWPVISRFVGG